MSEISVHLFPNCSYRMVGPTVFGSRHCKNVGNMRCWDEFWPFCRGHFRPIRRTNISRLLQSKNVVVGINKWAKSCSNKRANGNSNTDNFKLSEPKLLGPTLLPNKREKGLLWNLKWPGEVSVAFPVRIYCQVCSMRDLLQILEENKFRTAFITQINL